MKKIKRKVGRPKGIIDTKGKIKLIKSYSTVGIIPKDEDSVMVNKDEKRRPGRPKGSKNKSVIVSNEELNKGENKVRAQYRKPPPSMGRPKGSRNKITLALEQIGKGNAQAVYSKLVDLALGRTNDGDVMACKLILDRVFPQRKGRRFNFEIEKSIETARDVSDLSKKVVNMMAMGELSAEESLEIGNKLEQHLKIITDVDVMDKIENTCQKVDMLKNGK